MKKNVIYRVMGMILIVMVLLAVSYRLFFQKNSFKETTIKVGIVLYREDDDFIASMKQAMEEQIPKIIEKHESEQIDFQFFDSKNSQSYQNDIVESLIKDEYDVLCINLVDRTAASVTIDRAKVADIPVIFFNREPVEADLARWNHVYYVGSNPERAGIMQGQLILQFEKNHPSKLDKNKDGKIQYYLLEGEALHQDAILRTKYTLQTISEKLVIENISREIADWSYANAYQKTKELLKTTPNIELIISNNDEMALGARDALLESSLPENKMPYIVGIDGLERSLKLSNQTIWFDTIINDHQSQAKQILKLVGEEIFEQQKNHKKSRYYMIPYKNTKKL